MRPYFGVSRRPNPRFLFFFLAVLNCFTIHCSPSLQVPGPSDNEGRPIASDEDPSKKAPPNCRSQNESQPRSLPLLRVQKPAHACHELWQISDVNSRLLNFDYSTDTQIEQSPLACISGNFGYPKYQQRLKLFLQQTRGLSATDGSRERCYKDLTTLVYMAADNDLNSYAFWDLFEMESPHSKAFGGSQLYTDFLVEVDSAGPYGRRRIHIFQTPGETKDYQTKAKELEKLAVNHFANSNYDRILSPVVEELPESSENHEARFFDFVRWGMTHYPSSHYLVVVWGHGQNSISSEGIGTIALDGNGNYMTVSELARQMGRIKEEVLGKNIDVYAADACLMQSVESTTALAPYTNYLVGTTQIQSSLGFNYRVIFKRINDLLRTYHRKKSFSDQEIRRSPRLTKCGYDIGCWIGFEFAEVTNSSSRHRNGQFVKLDPTSQQQFTISSLSSQQLISNLLPKLSQLGFLLKSYFENNPTEYQLFFEQVRFNPKLSRDAPSLRDLLTVFEDQISNRYYKNHCYSDIECLATISALEEALLALQDTVVNGYAGVYYKKSEVADLSEALSVWFPKTDRDPAKYFKIMQSSVFFKLSPGWMAFILNLVTGANLNYAPVTINEIEYDPHN